MNSRNDLTIFERQQLISIKNKIPANWISLITDANIIIVPNRKVKVIGTEINIFGCQNKNIYKALISDIQVIPTGFERWCLDLRLDIDKIDKYFLNAKKSTTHSFTRCFNYKILTKILPTREYLLRYQAPDIDDNVCKRCNLERDTIEHCLYECEKIQPFLNLLTNWIKQLAIIEFEMTLKTFLFGDIGNTPINKGLEHILLEAKKFVFYDLKDKNK